MSTLSIHLFRDDLRLADNPALSYNTETHQILPIYILEDSAFDGHNRQQQPVYQKDSYGAAGAICFIMRLTVWIALWREN